MCVCVCVYVCIYLYSCRLILLKMTGKDLCCVVRYTNMAMCEMGEMDIEC